MIRSSEGPLYSTRIIPQGRSLGAPVPQSCQGLAAEEGQRVGLCQKDLDLSEEPGHPVGMVRASRMSSVPVGKVTQSEK